MPVYLVKQKKAIASIFAVLFLLSAYVAIQFEQTNKQTSMEIFNTAHQIINKWHQLHDGLSDEGESLANEEILSLCVEKCTYLDLMIKDVDAVQDKYKKLYLALNLPEINKAILTRDHNTYLIAGYKIEELYPNPLLSKSGVFISGVDKQVLIALNKMYDCGGLGCESSTEGVIKYSQSEDGTFVVGIFINSNI